MSPNRHCAQRSGNMIRGQDTDASRFNSLLHQGVKSPTHPFALHVYADLPSVWTPRISLPIAVIGGQVVEEALAFLILGGDGRQP